MDSNLTFEVFDVAYRAFLEQADKNAISRKSKGSRTPHGTDGIYIGEFGLSQHFGQGAASKTPYLNWHVVSAYYLPNQGDIILGIEVDRYPHIGKMKSKGTARIGNRKTDVAVFFEDTKENLNMKALYEAFMQVCEEVVRFGVR